MQAEDNKNSVIITGAGRGLGRVIATTFATETDYALVLISRTESELQETRRLCEKAGSARVCYRVCDASDEEAVEKMTVPDDFPPPKSLVNNAGSYLYKTTAETTLEELHQQIQSNLVTAVTMTNRFLPELKKHSRSLIVNICSVGSVEGLADSGAYSISKHALLGYSRSLRKELMNSTVGVTAINLGQTESTSWEGSAVNRRRLIDPADVARLIVTLTRFTGRTVAEEILIRPQQGRVPPV